MVIKPDAPSFEAIVLGASAGAIGALNQILPAVRAALSVPFIIVVHIPAQRPSLLVELFTPKCAVAVREPFDKEPVAPGIWFAPPDYHVLIESNRTFSLTTDKPVRFSRPSIDVLFETAAHVYRDRLLGIVLTGASDDGADGARAIRNAGGVVVVQDPKTAEASLMPAAAIESSNPQVVAPLSQIAELLSEPAAFSRVTTS